MSVSFYDPENPTKYDENYNIIGGGPEANFANSNARMIIEFLGLETDPSLYGEISAQDLLRAIKRAELGTKEFCSDYGTKSYLDRAFTILTNVAESSLKHSGIVMWG